MYNGITDEYVKEDDKQKGEEIMQKAVDSVKRKEDRRSKFENFKL